MPACLDVVRGWQCCHWWLAFPFCVWWLRLAAVGWLSCVFGVESGECFLVFGHRRDWGSPGRDEAHAGVEAVHVATSGRP